MIFVPAAHRQCARDANTLSPLDGKSMAGMVGKALALTSYASRSEEVVLHSLHQQPAS